MPSARKTGARRRTSAGTPDYQLPLPLFEHGLQAIHQRPLVGVDKRFIYSRRFPDEAWSNWPYIQANPPHVYAVMLFDIDDPLRWEYEVDGPRPNWQVRKDSQPTTYHVAYTLENPVARHNAARLKPLRFFRDIYERLACTIGADPRYNGLMTKNPLHPPTGCSTQWFRHEPYTLSELLEWIPNNLPQQIPTTCVGRNEDLFHECIKLAHKPKWARIIQTEGYASQWLEHVRLLNVRSFAEDPLPDSECRSIAKSCAKYSLLQYSEHTFSKIQAARARRKAQTWNPPRTPGYFDSIVEMKESGYTTQQIADRFGLSRRTIHYDLAKVRRGRKPA